MEYWLVDPAAEAVLLTSREAAGYRRGVAEHVMRWAYAARARLRLLLFREEVEQRLDEEFRFHLDMETERLVRDAPVDPREARRRARATFGGVEAHKDAVRDGRGWPGCRDSGATSATAFGPRARCSRSSLPRCSG